MPETLFDNATDLKPEQETLAQVISYEFCKNCKNLIFHRTPPGDWF